MTTPAVTANDVAYIVAQTVNGFPTEGIQSADVLYPNPDAGGNPAIVITARDGSRYGLEVCPIPEPHQLLPNAPIGEPKMLNDQDLKAAIRTTLGDHPDSFNVDGIAEAIREEYGPIGSLDDVPTEDYWEIVKAYDGNGAEVSGE